jgi:hypothetical protein
VETPVAAQSSAAPLIQHLREDLDLSQEMLVRVLDLAAQVKSSPQRFSHALAGRYLGLLFEKPSLRTRTTFELGIKQLGGDAVTSVGAVGEREPVKDVVRNLDRWTQANAGRFYLVLKVFSGFRSCASQPDSWHQYGPAVAESHQAGYSFTISPGFWRIDEASPRLARDAAVWRQNVRDMVASGEPWQLITTWNEYGEGTVVEPTTQFGSSYLDILASPGP